MGRTKSPITSGSSKNTTPSTVNSRKCPTRSVMIAPSSLALVGACSGCAVGRRTSQQRLTSGKTRVQLVPVPDFLFAQEPAQVDFTAVHDRPKINEPAADVLEFDPQVFQFFDEFLKAGDFPVEFFFDLYQFFTVKIVSSAPG